MSSCLTVVGCKVPVTLILLLIYISYLLVGAAVFWALESQAEETLTLNFQREKWELLRNHTCMDNRTLELFISGIISAYKNGVIPWGNSSNLGTWSFSGSFFFSVTAITTIGYGNIVPTTSAGQVFCIFFALFGIPLNVILLNRIGQKMLLLVHMCANLLGKSIHRQRMIKILTSSCALILGLLLFLLLPPVLFTGMEGWTYEEGFYYSFITLSTIGFGDYVAGRNPDREYPAWYRNVVAIWILFGLAWLALVINLFINLLENFKEKNPCKRKKKEEKAEKDLIENELDVKLPCGDEKDKECNGKDLHRAEDGESFTGNKIKYETSD